MRQNLLNGINIKAFKMNHTPEAQGYRIESRNISIAYSGDTAPNPTLAKFAKGVSLLIHDATFAEIHSDKAAEYLHSTAQQAAEIAKQAKAKKLALIHISPRYETSQKHEQEAQTIFPQSFAPNDFDTIDLR